MKLAILDDWFNTLHDLPCFETLAGIEVSIFNTHEPDLNKLAQRLLPFDAITLFRERTPIPRALIERLPNLKLISQRSVYPHIDIDACTDHGILVCSNMHTDTPSIAAAEHTWALIMAAMRDIPAQMASLQAGTWQMGVGKTLSGRQLGLYGYGRIARQVAVYAAAFGMNIIWWASAAGRERARGDNQPLAGCRDAFFATSDVVSVHVRLNENTRGIITAEDLHNMSEHALFVNCSRDGLIEEGALLAALDVGRPGKAAIDVFDQEPITEAGDRRASHPRLVATPHIGFVTEDEFEIQFADIFDQVMAWRNGRPINVINPKAM